MFRQAKNIDTAFRQYRLFTILFMLLCLAISSLITLKCFQMVDRDHKHVFVLVNGKLLEAFSADRKDNLAVEARDHIKTFHHYFFSLDPDDKVIQSNITKALYLADNSAERAYQNLKEQGYYSDIISSNISQQLSVDSVTVDLNQYPYAFHFYGKEKLIRTTSIVTRNLVTEGFLRNVSQSDNNPHGFLIEKWSIIDNKDLSIQNR